jgi:MFS family permease
MTLTPRVSPSARVANWFARWGGIAPLLLAEFIVWVGFGALLPILPLYFTEQGVDLGTLGIVIAAWPIARLVGEPIFGWLADRTARVPLMVIGLIATGVFSVLPLVLTGPLAFVVLRAGAGLATAVYDPAARGYLTDATEPSRRGEAFGLYGAAQMGGLLLGPAIGSFGAGRFGGIAFVFVFGGLAAIVAAMAIALRVRETPLPTRTHPGPAHGPTEFPPEDPGTAGRAAAAVDADRADRAGRAGDSGLAGVSAPAGDSAPTGGAFGGLNPSSLWNRGLIAAIVLNAGGYFAGGTYEVIWSLFLDGLGASLDLIGLTFAMFGLPILLLSPYAGRLVDRGGVFLFIVAGSIAPAVAGVAYTLIVDPLLAVPLILIEATGFAFLNPALYSVVAASSPRGRSSTAQGLFGAAGTVGFIVASLSAGYLAELDIRFPFYVFTAVLITTLVVSVVIAGPVYRQRPVPTRGE